MRKIWTLWIYSGSDWLYVLPRVSREVCEVSEKVVALFSLDYIQMREYFNRIIMNFIQFWEIEHHFVVSFYRYLDMCSSHHLKHFLKEISHISIKDVEFERFLVQVKNYIISKVNFNKNV